MGKAQQVKKPDEVPAVTERQQMRTRLLAKGLKAAEVDAIVTDRKSRKEVAEDLKAFCRALPRDNDRGGGRG